MVAPPTVELCHDVPESSPFWPCLEDVFCAAGSLGITPLVASNDFSIRCGALSPGDRVQHIQYCHSFTDRQDIVPPPELFEAEMYRQLEGACGVPRALSGLAALS